MDDSPIGMKKHFPTYIHLSAENFENIYVSAGQRGLQVLLAPADLVRETNASLADLVKRRLAAQTHFDRKTIESPDNIVFSIKK